MSVAGTSRDSHSNAHSANGRKRRLSHSPSTLDKTQTKLKQFSDKHKRPCRDVTDLSPATYETMSYHSATSPMSDTNHKLPCPKNSLAAKAALNNHSKKPGQAKKLVIKNRRGMEAVGCVELTVEVL